ncbi:MAG: peptidoglycan recognition family protein, partial [Phycisphaerales bacterium JB038]
MESHRRAFLRLMLGVGAAPLLTACSATSGESATRRRRPLAEVESVPPLPDELTNWQPMDGSTQRDLASLLGALPRSRWATAAPIPSRMNSLGQANIEHITVHHEGSSAVYFDGMSQVQRRLDSVRRGHLSRAWGDIGYHFIIDRAGRVWEGRPLQYQGAHVKNHNYHNLGVMALGNFDEQSPTQAQLDRLVRVIKIARATCNVPMSRLHTHQELGPTRC